MRTYVFFLYLIPNTRLAGQEMMLRSSENSDKSTSKSLQPNTSPLNDEDGYFASYTHHDIHMTMLKVYDT